MPRPTVEDLGYATDDLEELAHRHCPRDNPKNETGFPDLISILNFLVQLDTMIQDARQAAAYGPGVKDGYRTLQHGSSGSDIDSRTRDLLLKELRDIRSGCLVELGSMRDRWYRNIEKVVGKGGLRAG